MHFITPVQCCSFLDVDLALQGPPYELKCTTCIIASAGAALCDLNISLLSRFCPGQGMPHDLNSEICYGFMCWEVL